MTKIAVREKSVRLEGNANESTPVVPIILVQATNSVKASLLHVWKTFSKAAPTPPTVTVIESVMKANVRRPVLSAPAMLAKLVAMTVSAKAEQRDVRPKRLPKIVKAVKHASMVDALNLQVAPAPWTVLAAACAKKVCVRHLARSAPATKAIPAAPMGSASKARTSSVHQTMIVQAIQPVTHSLHNVRKCPLAKAPLTA